MRERLLRLSRLVRRLRRQHWLALVGLSLAAYFGYHAVNGSRGLLAWQQVTVDLAASQQELDALRATREALEGRAARLRPGSLDPDLIDELARKELSFAQPLDVIILLDGDDRAR
jgi:cell division protein FtsB